MGVAQILLPVLQVARTILDGPMGLRNASVTVRTVTWSGTRVGAGTPTASDLLLSPNPKVKEVDGDRRLQVTRITPAWSGGGYTRDQLRPDTDRATAPNVEFFYVVEGDNGAHPYALISINTGRSMEYALELVSLDRRLPF